jgi:ubiquinone/menaquinone biosynthesis C-methylase UbiE
MAGAAAAAQEHPKMHNYERQSLKVEDFDATGYVLDIGGGGEGIIGRLKPSQVVAIDLYKRELEESPAGPLKIVMDATDLKFLDASFDTVTAFYSLMYMRAEVQKKVFAEAARVLKPGGRWLIWDAVIPAAVDSDTKGPAFYFEFKLPKETVRTGYGTFWPPQPMDVAWYRALAGETGLKVASAKEQPGEFRTFHMELRKA